MLVVSDTGPVNYLVLIGAIHVLPELYGYVLLPEAVYRELTHSRTPEKVRQWIANKPTWLEVRAVTHPIEATELEAGEREAIALALSTKADVLLVDDGLARQEAQLRGVDITGTLGVLEKAAQKGLIDLVKMIEALRETNYRIRESVLQEVLERHLGR